MAWNRIGNVAALSLALIFIACGGDSGNNMSNDEPSSNASATFTYRTYEGLVAEEPCGDRLRGAYAHVNENDADYVCVFDDDTIPGESWLENCFSNIPLFIKVFFVALAQASNCSREFIFLH